MRFEIEWKRSTNGTYIKTGARESIFWRMVVKQKSREPKRSSGEEESERKKNK